MIGTVPDTFEVVEEFRGPVRFDFDERISERITGGTLDDAVMISPRTGDVRASQGRRSIVVEVDGGFRPGLVYRVTLLPMVSDLFGNQMRDPFEIVFSTGGRAVPTTMAGIVWDRVTGRGASNYEVRAVGFEDDSLMHVAVTDTGGVYLVDDVYGNVSPENAAARKSIPTLTSAEAIQLAWEWMKSDDAYYPYNSVIGGNPSACQPVSWDAGTWRVACQVSFCRSCTSTWLTMCVFEATLIVTGCTEGLD